MWNRQVRNNILKKIKYNNNNNNNNRLTNLQKETTIILPNGINLHMF